MLPGDPAECRQWIADSIVAGGSLEPPSSPIEDILATAEREGVTGLLLRQLAGFEWDGSGKQALEQARRMIAMRELAGLAEMRRMLAPLADAGLPFLLLKGNALAYWLYASPLERPRVDLDVLVDGEGAADHAVHVLRLAGFDSIGGVMPSQASGYELAMERRDQAKVLPAIDLHWRLLNRAFLAGVLSFPEMWAASIPLPGLHPSARGLGRIHALMHALLHRVTNIPVGRQDRLIWLHDIHLLASGCGEDEWQWLQARSVEEGVATPCLDGLRASRQVFDTRIPADVEQALATAAAGERWNLAGMDAAAMDRGHLAALPWRKKASWLRRKLLPSPEFMRHRYGVRGPIALARAYLARLWLGLRRGSRL